MDVRTSELSGGIRTLDWTPESAFGSIQSEWAGTRAPLATDDIGEGYSTGSLWRWAAKNMAWLCVDSTDDAAEWRLLNIHVQSCLVATDGGTLGITTYHVGYAPLTALLLDIRVTSTALVAMSPYTWDLNIGVGATTIVLTDFSALTELASVHGFTPTLSASAGDKLTAAPQNADLPTGLQLDFYWALPDAL